MTEFGVQFQMKSLQKLNQLLNQPWMVTTHVYLHTDRLAQGKALPWCASPYAITALVACDIIKIDD